MERVLDVEDDAERSVVVCSCACEGAVLKFEGDDCCLRSKSRKVRFPVPNVLSERKVEVVCEEEEDEDDDGDEEEEEEDEE